MEVKTGRPGEDMRFVCSVKDEMMNSAISLVNDFIHAIKITSSVTLDVN